MANNNVAIRFNKKIGFHINGYHRKLISSDREGYIDAVEMEKWIEGVVKKIRVLIFEIKIRI